MKALFYCRSYLDFLVVFLAVVLVDFLAAEVFSDDAGFKIIDLTLRKDGTFTEADFFGIRTLTEEAFFGALSWIDACLESWLIAASQSFRLELAGQPLFFQI